MLRRGLGIGAGVLLVLLAALLVRGCLDARQERAYESYIQEVASLAAESSQESEAVFELLDDPGGQEQVDVQNALNGFSLDAQRLVEQAEAVEPPDELVEAHQRLELTLELRAAGLEGLSNQLPSALGDEQQEEAIESIARDMRSFLASDVVFEERVVPQIQETLEREELSDVVVDIPESQFLPGVEWLDPEVVGDAIGELDSEGGAGDDEAATPGLHGTGIVATVAQPSGVTLTPDAPTEISGGEDAAFEVQVQNQGENDEDDVTVTLSLQGGGADSEVESSIDQIAAGETETVELSLEEPPPTDEELEAVVEVEPVAGEENAENNEATYPVVFTGE